VEPATPQAAETPAKPDGPTEALQIRPTPAPAGPETRIEAAIENVRGRDLLMSNGFWTIFHGILGLGPKTVMLRNEETGQKVNAVEYICAGGELRGLAFPITKHGLDVQMGPAYVGQGHQDQFIAEMGQWGMKPDQKFIVQGREFTYMDFANESRMRARVNANQELSWAICVVSQFYGTNHAWTNARGEHLTLEDLVRYEVDAPIEEAACGGTHRLFGYYWAYYMHLRQGGKTTGVWNDVVAKTRKYIDLAKKYQNADGSFSTSWFRGPGDNADKGQRITTTGHTLEWLALVLSDEEIKEGWVADAANALSLTILDLQNEAIEGGALYHAVHGLLMFYARVHGPKLGPTDLFIPLPPKEARPKGA
jgi:hypothetical protein